MLALFALLSSSAYGIQTLPLVNEEEIIAQVKVDNNKISDIPENEFLEQYSYLKEGFEDLTISIETDEAIFDKENFYHPLSFFDRVKSFFGAEIPEYKIIKEVKKVRDELQTKIELQKIKIKTRYKEISDQTIKQTLTLTNENDHDLNLSLLLKNRVEADTIYWNGGEYEINENPQKFSNPDRIAFYTPNEEYLSFYDFSDIPEEFSPELWVEKNDSQTILILSLNIFIPQNSSKTINPKYSSLKAKEELPEKTTISSKTHIKTLPDLTKVFAWEGTVGARYFKDNDQWYSRLLIDDRPNKVVLRNAKVAVEVYPGFTKYFDVDYQEERVKSEKWLLEKKVGDQWENIELGSPIMEIIQGEHPAGDYIGVKNIYNTAFGIFEIEYFLRDGNALKHTITFQNTKGSTETFRVIQRWEGIAGDKVNGKDVPLETDSSYLAFHYAEDDPKDFTVSEDLSSMIFNEDGTEKKEHRLQRPVKIDKDIQGMKADFVFGNWILAQNESLEIDPDTATLDDPTVDGYIMADDEPATTWADYPNEVYLGLGNPVATEIMRAYVEWDVSSIPDGATITDTVFKYEGRYNQIDGHINEMVGYRPSLGDAESIYNEAGEGTIYADPVGFPVVGTGQEVDLGSSADTDLKNQLSVDWFAIGIQSDDEADFESGIQSEDKTDAADPKPTLYVEYTLPLPLGESCTSGSECDSGNCQFEVCCESDCTGDCHCFASSDPTEDGDIYYDSVTYVRDNTSATLRTYFVVGVLLHAYVEWDIESIPDLATITDTVFKYHGDTAAWSVNIRAMASQPSIQSNDDAGNQVIYDDCGDGTIYVADYSFAPLANQEVDLGTDADTDLQNALASDWFAIGTHQIGLGGAWPSRINSEDKTGPAADPKPTLYVEYTVDTSPPTFSAITDNSSSTTYNGTDVQINITIEDATNVDFYTLSHNDSISFPDTWADEDFTKCKDITITISGSTLTDFPVYVNVTYDSDMQTDYEDLRFVDASCDNGGSELNYEIENYTVTKADIWVKTTLATGDNIISVYYGNAGASSGENPTGVWDDNFVMVQHMDDLTTSSIEDSTQYNNDGTKKGANEPIEDASGIVDSAQTFDGDDDYVSISNEQNFDFDDDEPVTFSFWIKSSDLVANQWIYSKQDTTSNGVYILTCVACGSASNIGETRLLYQTTSDGLFRVDSTVTVIDGNWHHVVYSGDGGADHNGFKVYVDGVEGTTKVGDTLTGSLVNNAAPFLGTRSISPTGTYLNGTLDEFRISNITRSADWINQSYQLVQNQGTYVVFGSEESRPSPLWTNETIIDVEATTVNVIWNYTIKHFPTTGGILGVRFWANDTGGYSAESDIHTITVQAIVVDTCTYSSGDWSVTADDNCVISSDVDLGGDDLILTGTGTLDITAKISNFGKIVVHGSGAKIVCRNTNGCFG